MNNKKETLLNNHINRLKKDIKDRDHDTFSDGTRCNQYHAMKDKVDLKNIASLREGRTPQWTDHMDYLSGWQSMDISKFSDLETA